ncbi:MAG TPA: DUF2945 domain-containing protein [Acidimicrobiales bacterium]|jgi:hypothetical protein|nr:DUF2945 domain-containing protein [Acidimicrobiales bacterium]
MAENIRKGDHVEWNTSQCKTHGRVERIVTQETHVQGTTLKGSKDDPVYIVKSDKTGKEAGHKASGLTRIK